MIFTRIGAGVAVMLAISLGVYVRYVRPWQLRWGATDDEVARAMPGDNVVTHPTFNATRAVTVRARPEEIWPWLVQMGVTRAGWYSYDWLDNLGHPSVDRIVPEFQKLAVGDVVPMSPDGQQGQHVKSFDPNRWLLWGDDHDAATWCWVLDPIKGGDTRLLARMRIHYHWTSPAILFDLLVEFTDIIMMRKCMLGIKQRAEQHRQANDEVRGIPAAKPANDGRVIAVQVP